MNVRDLMLQLKEMEPDTEVFFEHPSHDYWRTELATEVDVVETTTVEWSEYHHATLTRTRTR